MRIWNILFVCHDWNLRRFHNILHILDAICHSFAARQIRPRCNVHRRYVSDWNSFCFPRFSPRQTDMNYYSKNLPCQRNSTFRARNKSHLLPVLSLFSSEVWQDIWNCQRRQHMMEVMTYNLYRASGLIVSNSLQ